MKPQGKINLLNGYLLSTNINIFHDAKRHIFPNLWMHLTVNVNQFHQQHFFFLRSTSENGAFQEHLRLDETGTLNIMKVAVQMLPSLRGFSNC